MTPDEASSQLNDLLHNLNENYTGGLSNTSTQKFNNFRQFFQDILNLGSGDIYIVGAGTRTTNIPIRLTQGRQGTRHTRLGVGFVTTDDEDKIEKVSDSAMTSIRRYVVERGRGNYEAIIVLVVVNENVHVSKLMQIPGSKIGGQISTIFPECEILEREDAPTEPQITDHPDHIEVENIVDAFDKDLKRSGLIFPREFLVRFISSLLTKRFVILTGLSGSGKTKIAQCFVHWIDSDQRYSMVAVGADWNNSDPILGYPDALRRHEKGYSKPSNDALDLILRAKTDPEEKPYFLILDEMNLSHVEKYFADLLSAIESGEPVDLHDGGEEELWDEVPGKLIIPQNLFVIGTVNIDETTYLFSPKVLDRANVIEFRVTEKELGDFLSAPTNFDIKRLEGKGNAFAEAFSSAALLPDVGAANLAIEKEGTLRYFEDGEELTDGEESTVEKLKSDLISIFNPLQKAGSEFGFRTANEIQRFLYYYRLVCGSNAYYKNALDAQVMQKLLPKLHGSIRRLGPVLDEMKKVCAPDGLNLPVSAEKIQRMISSLDANGFTSYAEA